MVKELIGWGKALLLSILVVFIVKTFILVPVSVSGESMEPNIHNNDRFILTKFSDSYERFDVIVVKEPKTKIIKRVIGLPGEEVTYKNDQLYINGKKIEEPFIKQQKEQYKNMKSLYTLDFTLKDITGKTKIPNDCVFVLGDNRPISSDSREFGFVKREQILGKADLRYYPFDSIKYNFN